MRRFMRYAQRRFAMLSWLSTLTESRTRVSISLRTMALCMFMLVSSRLGSLNALEKSRSSRFWKRYGVVGRLPSADQLGRVAAGLPARDVRRQLKKVYTSLKRRKALHPGSDGNHFALVVDGHESSASYLRCCKDCLTRRINKDTPQERTQYYHRLVMGVLVCKRFTLLLDAEMQVKGENEVRTAERLLARLLVDYPRAFDLVVADGLYAQAPFFKMVRTAGKHAIAVLKNAERELVGDVLGLCNSLVPRNLDTSRTKRHVWDIEELTSWSQVGMPVRVVRSLETTTVKRQTDGALESQTTQWMWVTTIPSRQLPAEQVLDIGHGRWAIENNAFNELVTYWHADHVYKHDANAILVFWLMTMLAYNLFHAFYFFNVKPSVREQLDKYRLAAGMTADLLVQCTPAPLRSP